MKGSCLWLAGAVLLSAGMVAADDDHDYLEARQLVRAGTILPLEQILARLNRPQGQLLEVELELEDGAYLYEIEFLDSAGQVWELEVDAATGELLRKKQEE